MGEKVSVVVVDDERPLADLVARYLTREGYEVEVAHDGPEALELIERVDPDVIVLDLMLPGIDGLEVARRVGELEVDPASHEARLADLALPLTPIEFALLERLSSAPRQVWSKEQLLEQVWGSASYRDAHVVAVHVGNLRRKLVEAGDRSGLVHTVRGVGYRLVAS